MVSRVASPMLERKGVSRAVFLGIEVEPLSMPELNSIVVDAIDSGRHIVVANHNLHSIYLFHHDPKMRAFYATADHIHADGMAVVALAQILGIAFRREHRVTFVDWMGPLADSAARHGWRVFYLGSRPGVAEQGAEGLRKRYPGLQIRTAHGFFNPDPSSPEDREILATIEEWRPHLLITGMGMPRQEHWILDHRNKLSANVILNGGAALDYFAGVVPTPPRWAGRCGLEWFFRLAAEPQRLWSRYLLEPWFIAYKLAVEMISK